jgi:ABC-type transport system substrate-binding protein
MSLLHKRPAALAALAILGLLIIPTPLANQTVHAASSSSLVIGVLGTPPPSFFPVTGTTIYYVGVTASEIPYLPFGQLSLGGVYTSSIASIPKPVAGSNFSQWTISVANPGLKWSDGVPINASDLAYSIGIYLSTGPYANLSKIDGYGGITGKVSAVQILNSTTIQITETSGNPGVPYQIFPYDVLPWHYYKQFDNLNASIIGGPGDSAYIPAGYTAGSSVMNLAANPYSPSWDGRTPTASGITIEWFTDESSLVNALAAGTVDLASINGADVSALASSSFITTVSVASIFQLVLNIRSSGWPFNDTQFRQALQYLVPKAQINSEVYDNQSYVGNPVVLGPSSESWVPNNLPTYGYNPAAATQLLQSIGLHQNPQGQWALANGTALPAFTLEADDSDPSYVRAAQLIVSSWQSAGLPVSLQTVPEATVESDTYDTMKFDVTIQNTDYIPVPWRYLYNEDNWVNGVGQLWTNATFSSILAEARANPNATAQVQLLKQAEYALAQNAIVDGVVGTPEYLAYNNQQFTNITAAAQKDALESVPLLASFGEDVLTSAVPVGAVTGTSTSPSTTATSTTTGSTSVASSSSTGSGLSTDLPAIAIVVAVVVIALVGFAFVRRRRDQPSASGAGAPP